MRAAIWQKVCRGECGRQEQVSQEGWARLGSTGQRQLLTQQLARPIAASRQASLQLLPGRKAAARLVHAEVQPSAGKAAASYPPRLPRQVAQLVVGGLRGGGMASLGCRTDLQTQPMLETRTPRTCMAHVKQASRPQQSPHLGPVAQPVDTRRLLRQLRLHLLQARNEGAERAPLRTPLSQQRRVIQPASWTPAAASARGSATNPPQHAAWRCSLPLLSPSQGRAAP